MYNEDQVFSLHLCKHVIDMLYDEELKMVYHLGQPAITFNSRRSVPSYIFERCPICGEPIKVLEENK